MDGRISKNRRAVILAGIAIVALAFMVGLKGKGSGEVEGSSLAVLNMEATAYSLVGPTKSGVPAQSGVVAADPNVLPLGTRIRVRQGEEDLGEFVVTDTGRAIKGYKIDIYMQRNAHANNFGRQDVVVEVLKWGQGAESAREEVAAGMQ